MNPADLQRLTSYQRVQVRRLERAGWTVGPIKHMGATLAGIYVQRGSAVDRTVAMFPATRELERELYS